jgi:TP901 family phage tail tape measure protein
MAMGDIVLRIVTKGADLAKKQLDGVGGSGDKSGKKLASFGKMAKVAGIAVGVALAKGLQKSVEAFMEFDDKMTQSLAIMNTTVEQNEAMEKAALELSRSTRISASDSAEAYFFLASAGLDAEQSIQALPQVAKFAQAGMFDMATATDLATDAQSALGLTVKDAQQNLENLTRVTDVLVKGNQLANASVQQFSEALTNKAGAALKVVNKDIEEGMAVLAAFADRGVKGAEAGDKLNQVLRDIPRATAKNSEEFEKLGLNMFDTNGNMKNVADIVEELDAVLGPMSDEMKAATLDQLGLNRGVADAVKILSGAGDQIREYEEALRSSGGATDEVANNQMESLKAQTDLMRNAFQELGIAIGKIVSGPLTKIVKAVTGVTQSVTDSINSFSDFREEMAEVNEEVDNNIYGTITATDSYYKYATAIGATTDQKTDFRSATEKAIDVQRILNEEQTNFARTEDIIAEALAKHNSEQEQLNRNAEEYKEIQEEIAEAQKEKALPTLNTMFQAYKKIQDIQDNITDLQKDEKKALEKLTKEKEELDKANKNVIIAEEELARQKEISKQVTLEEEIAILRQVEAIKRLEEQEEKTLLTEKELELAKRKLEEITIASTSATNDEERALNNVERAKKTVEDQTESLKKAQEQYREATEDLAEATAKSTENLMEMAIAKAELDKAISDVKALGLLEDSIAQLVKNAGGDFDSLLAKMNMIMNFSGQSGFNIPGSDTSSSSTGSDVFDTEGNNIGAGAFTPPGNARESARDQALRVARTSDTNVTLNVNGVLTTMEVPQMVAEVVKKAREQGLDFL